MENEKAVADPAPIAPEKILQAEQEEKDKEYHIDPKKRVKIHSSHIKSFLMCPSRFFFQYVKGIKTPRPVALVLGSALHKAAEINLVQKRESRVDLPEDDILDAFEERWELDHKGEVQYEAGESRGEEKDLGIQCTKALARVVMPSIQPKEVELKIETPITNRSFDIAGRIDTLDDKNIIRDFKSTGGYLSKDKAGIYRPTSLDIIQITQYHLQAGAAQIEVAGTELSYIHKKIPAKGGLPNVWVAPFKPTEDNQNAFLRIADKISEAVQRESYVPNPTSFICSPEKCGFWAYCRGGAIF